MGCGECLDEEGEKDALGDKWAVLVGRYSEA